MPFVAPAGAPRRTPRSRAGRRRVTALATTALTALVTLLALVVLPSAPVHAAEPRTSTSSEGAAPKAATATATGGTCPVSSRYETKVVDGSSQLFRIGAHDGRYTSEQIGGVAGIRYGALALDPTSGSIHAIADIPSGTSPTDSSGTRVRTGDLLVVDRESGRVTTTGRPDGLPAQAARSAAFSDDGRLYVVPEDASGTFIDYTPATGSVVTRNLTPTGTDLGADLSWADGYLWGRQDSNGGILRLDPATGVVSTFPAPNGLTVDGKTTGVFTFGNGNLGFVDDAGTTTQVDIGPADYPRFRVVSVVPSPADPGDGAVTCVSGTADLAVSTSGPATVEPNGVVTWTVEVRNVGSTPSSGWTMNDVLPAGYTDVEVPDRCSTSGTTISCPGGRLAPGEKRTLNYSATAPATAQCSYDTATIIGDETDPVPSNDTAQLTTCVNAHPALELAVTSDPGAAQAVPPGETVIFTVEASNAGNAPLSNVVLDVDLADLLDDAALHTDTVAATRGSAPTTSSESLVWKGTLQVGEVVVVTYEATVGPAFTGADRIETKVSATSAETDATCGGAPSCTTTLVPSATAAPTGSSTPAPSTPAPSTPTSSAQAASTPGSSGTSGAHASDDAAAIPTAGSGNGQQLAPTPVQPSAAPTGPVEAAALASTGEEPTVNVTLAAVFVLVALGALVTLRRRH